MSARMMRRPAQERYPLTAGQRRARRWDAVPVVVGAVGAVGSLAAFVVQAVGS